MNWIFVNMLTVVFHSSDFNKSRRRSGVCDTVCFCSITGEGGVKVAGYGWL